MQWLTPRKMVHNPHTSDWELSFGRVEIFAFFARQLHPHIYFIIVIYHILP